MLWHYTNGLAAFEILKAGFLEPRDEFVLGGELPILWFSRNSLWEPLANKQVDRREWVVGCSMAETAFSSGGLYRFSAPKDAAIRGWPEIGQLANMRPAMIEVITSLAKEHGTNPVHWHGLLHRVPTDGLIFQMITADALGAFKWVDVPHSRPLGWLMGILLKSGLPLGDDVMTRENPRWSEFSERLRRAVSADGCRHELDSCGAVLTDMNCNLEACSLYLGAQGGLCDCEILAKVIDRGAEKENKTGLR